MNYCLDTVIGWSLVLSCVVQLMGCSNGGKENLESNHIRTENPVHPWESDHRITIHTVLDHWKHGNLPEALALFHDISTAPSWQSELRAFAMTEEEFASHSYSKRQALASQMYVMCHDLRKFCHEALQFSHDSMDEGKFFDAKRIIDAVRKCGLANSGDDTVIVKVGNLTGNAIVKSAEESEAALAQLTDHQ